MKKIVLMMVLLFVSLSMTSSADEPTAEQKQIAIVQQTLQATVKITALVTNDVSEGTGFFVAPDTVLTAAHVVMKAGVYRITIRTYDNRSCSGKLGYRDEGYDLALLTVDCEGTPLKIGKPAKTGQIIYTVGNPTDFDFIATQGIVASDKPIREYGLTMDLPVNHGSSGGAIVNSDGEVVGVELGISDESPYLSFASGVKTIADVLQRAGID